MKKIILSIITLVALGSCSTNTKKTSEENNEPQPTETNAIAGRKIIEEVKQYFSIIKPTEITTMVLDEDGFDNNFMMARTMDIPPTIIDFDTYKVGAIVLPETTLDTEITLDNVAIVNKVLVVNYSIVEKGDKRSFTIVPVKAFMYSPQLSIDSVSFVNKDRVHTYAK